MANILQVGRWFSGIAGAAAGRSSTESLETSAIYTEHADFVWRTLQQLGVHEQDREDLLQEVFIVVHRKLSGFNGGASMTAWLFGICKHVTVAYRRRPHHRRELADDSVPETTPSNDELSPETAAEIREKHKQLEAILNELDLDRRAVLVMFEIDELSCEAIATLLCIPLGTVYSRLHAARKEFVKALRRHEARTARKGGV